MYSFIFFFSIFSSVYAAPLLAATATSNGGMPYGMQAANIMTSSSSPPPHHVIPPTTSGCAQQASSPATLATGTSNGAHENHSDDYDASPKSTQSGGSGGGAGGSGATGGALPAFQRIAGNTYGSGASGVERYASVNNYRSHVRLT